MDDVDCALIRSSTIFILARQQSLRFFRDVDAVFRNIFVVNVLAMHRLLLCAATATHRRLLTTDSSTFGLSAEGAELRAPTSFATPRTHPGIRARTISKPRFCGDPADGRAALPTYRRSLRRRRRIIVPTCCGVVRKSASRSRQRPTTGPMKTSFVIPT